MAAWSSKDGEFAKSTTTCAPSSASARPSPVIVLTPVLGAAARASCPSCVSLLTTFEPMSPVPPITTIFMTSPFIELSQFGLRIGVSCSHATPMSAF